MSDLAATNCGCAEERCGCGCDNGCGNGCGSGFGLSNFGGNGSCSCILWIIILFALCGNNGCGGNGFSNNGDCCWIIIVLLLLCGNGCGNGCGC